MIRRFLYRSFWNFYDYLGSYFIIGAVSTFVFLGLVTGAGALLNHPGVLGFAGAGFLGLVLYVLASCVVAAAFRFGDKAAHDLPARWPDFVQGVKVLSFRYMACLFAISLGFMIIIANARFYSSLGSRAGGGVGIALAALAAAFLWFGLGYLCYSLPLLGAAAQPDPIRWLALLRRAFVYLSLAPGLWFFVFISCAVFIVLAILSRVGIIFILPVLACTVTTAHWLVKQYAGYLAEAREALGEGQAIRAYKAKATDLAWQWELRQPRRTLRELIKPWEY